MRKFLMTALLCLLPFSAMAQQQAPSVLDNLKVLGEIPMGGGIMASGLSFLLFVNPTTRTFSIVAMGPQGAQVIVEGKRWIDLEPSSVPPTAPLPNVNVEN